MPVDVEGSSGVSSIGGFLGHCETGVSSAPVDVGGFLTINAPSESCSVPIWLKVFAPGLSLIHI